MTTSLTPYLTAWPPCNWMHTDTARYRALSKATKETVWCTPAESKQLEKSLLQYVMKPWQHEMELSHKALAIVVCIVAQCPQLLLYAQVFTCFSSCCKRSSLVLTWASNCSPMISDKSNSSSVICASSGTGSCPPPITFGSSWGTVSDSDSKVAWKSWSIGNPAYNAEMQAALTWQGYACTIWRCSLFSMTEKRPCLFDCVIDECNEQWCSLEKACWWCSLKNPCWWCSNKWWCKRAQILQIMPCKLHSITWYHIFDDVYWSWLIAYIAWQWHTDSWKWHTSSPLSLRGRNLWVTDASCLWETQLPHSYKTQMSCLQRMSACFAVD